MGKQYRKKLWKILTSVRLAVVLIAVIAVLCVLATILPQNQRPEIYTQAYGDVMASVIDTLALNNIFNSFWMYLASFLFGINLVCCTILRLKWAAGISKKKFKFYAWGSPVLHLGLCIVLAGIMVSMFTSRKGYYEVPEGQSVVINEAPVPYRLFVEDFIIEYYEDGKTPSRYASVLRLDHQIDADPTAMPADSGQYTVEVNHPVKYNESAIVQNSYGWMMNVTLSAGKASQTFDLRNEEWMMFSQDPQNRMAITAAFFPDYEVDENGNPFSRSDQTNNPHIVCVLTENDKPIAMEALAPGEEANLVGNMNLRFNSYSHYTGLQIKYDPGIAVTYVGFVLILLGLAVRFIFSDKEKTAAVRKEKHK